MEMILFSNFIYPEKRNSLQSRANEQYLSILRDIENLPFSTLPYLPPRIWSAEAMLQPFQNFLVSPDYKAAMLRFLEMIISEHQ